MKKLKRNGVEIAGRRDRRTDSENVRNLSAPLFCQQRDWTMFCERWA